MNKLIVAVVIVGIASAFAVSELEQRNQFQLFKQNFGKSYSSSIEEERRFRIFQNNLAAIDEKNRLNPKTTFGVTKFADLSQQEFKDLYLMKRDSLPPLAPGKVARIPKIGGVPSSFDWNNKTGVVTPVKDQGQCGSCWDFSATETLESVWARAGHPLPVLSEQQTVDCDTVDQGCNGGWPYDAYQYMMQAGGVESESDYPYTAVDGTCAFDSSKVVAKVSNWQYVSQNADESGMKTFLYANSPLSVCVNAEEWQFYTGGVMTQSACGGNTIDDIDHCVQATGWTTFPDGTAAWNVRNSWNTIWGNDGYIWVEYGTNACAIGLVVTVPTV